jgi:hypothetical protein
VTSDGFQRTTMATTDGPCVVPLKEHVANEPCPEGAVRSEPMAAQSFFFFWVDAKGGVFR